MTVALDDVPCFSGLPEKRKWACRPDELTPFRATLYEDGR
jgi:hypothetical protein